MNPHFLLVSSILTLLGYAGECPTGSLLPYVIGANDGDTQVNGAVDHNGNGEIYIAGWTES